MRLFLLLPLIAHVYAARRSHSTRLARRQGFLGQLVPGILGPDPSPTTSLLDPVTITPSTASSSTTSTPTPTPTPSSTPTSTHQDGGLLGGLGSIVNTLGSNLGGAVSTVGSDLGGIIGGPPTNTPTPSPTSSPTDPAGSSTTTPDPSTNSTTPTSSAVSTPTSSPDGGLLGGLTSAVDGLTSDVGGIINPPGPSTSAPPATSAPPPGSPTPSGDPVSPTTPPSPPPTSSSDGGLLGGVVGGLTSAVGGVVSGVTSDLGGVVGTPTSSPSGPPTTTPNGPPDSSSSAGGGIIDTLTSDLSSVLGPATSVVGSVISSMTSDIGATPTVSLPTIDPTGSGNATVGPTPTGSVNATGPISVEPTGISMNSTISASPTISFPSTNISVPTTTVSQNQNTTDVTVTSTSTAVTTVLSVASELSFVLGESSLAFSSVATSTPSVTMTDPDQATTSVDPLAAQSATTLVAPPLPSGIPGWIYPRDRIDTSSTDLNGFTLISILFNQELGWMFEIANSISSSQVMAYMPVIINNALGISSDQVKTYALRVYIPDTYKSPSDSSQLGTLFLGYIPNDMVDPLAAQIKIKSSAFYTQGPDDNARALAQRVVSSYSLLSVSPNDNPGSGDPSNNSGNNNSSSDNGKTREEAIIGVVSALGAIAIMVLGFLIYRSYKRRQQLAHRRLSDPPGENLGVRPEGRQFDQDSVGGARRRSFYYAEDSLRGYESQPTAGDQLMAESSHRRNVVPGTISAPVLRGSTMNW